MDRIVSNPNLVAMTSHSMELAESYLPTPTLITPQTMDIVGSTLKLAMDFNESSLSKPTLMTSPPINHIESNYHPDPTLTTSQPMNHIENSMIPSILTSLHGVFHEQNPIVSQVVPFEVQPNVFYRSSITQLMATKLPQLQVVAVSQLKKGVKGVKRIINKFDNGPSTISKHPSRNVQLAGELRGRLNKK